MNYHWAPTERKVLSLDRGLYLIKYDSAADQISPPLMRVVCEPGVNEVILHPDASDPILDTIGSVIVIRAFRPGIVHVDLATASGSTSKEATLRIEALDAGVSGSAQDPARGRASAGYEPARGRTHGGFEPERAREPAPYIDRHNRMPVAQEDGHLEILGHVSRLGDVVVGPNEWLGGPGSPGRIEGFSIDWTRPAPGVSLRYCAASSGQSPAAAHLAGPGQFVGTRQQARPVVYLGLQLDGPNASAYELVVEGLFTGQGVQSQRGRMITMSGPSGREPLVGLRVAVQKVHASDQPRMEQPRMVASPGAASESARRVRMVKFV